MWLWKGAGEERNYTKFNIEHSAQMRPKDCPGKEVTCALQFGEFHVLGTVSYDFFLQVKSVLRSRITNLVICQQK